MFYLQAEGRGKPTRIFPDLGVARGVAQTIADKEQVIVRVYEIIPMTNPVASGYVPYVLTVHPRPTVPPLSEVLYHAEHRITDRALAVLQNPELTDSGYEALPWSHYRVLVKIARAAQAYMDASPAWANDYTACGSKEFAALLAAVDGK